jgi:hypothetical protein
MTYKQAAALMATAPSDNRPSRVNKSISRSEAVDIVNRCLTMANPEATLPDWLAKRVLQVSQDKMRPRMPFL